MEWEPMLFGAVVGALVTLAVHGLTTGAQLSGIRAELVSLRRDVDRLLTRGES